MTEEELVLSLHMRMASRRQARERRRISALGAAGAALTLCLVLLIFGEGTAHVGGTAGVFSGATMLFDGVGAYVLTALLAFMVGVAVAVLCIRSRGGAANAQKETEREEGDGR